MNPSTAQRRQNQRVLPFQGVANFRDLGGYPSADGRTTRWGILFRSGHLARATQSDRDLLSSLGVRTVVDFRTQSERDRRPSNLPTDTVRTLSVPVLDSADGTSLIEEMRRRVRENDFAGFDPYARMKLTYERFATQFSNAFARFIRVVLESGGEPVLWHCTAGKDRTGFAAVILLRLLGVNEEVAIDDYLLSGRYTKWKWPTIVLLRLTKGPGVANAVKGLMGVQRGWIQAALHTIDRRWGGFEAYRADALRLSESNVVQLRETLLAPA